MAIFTYVTFPKLLSKLINNVKKLYKGEFMKFLSILITSLLLVSCNSRLFDKIDGSNISNSLAVNAKKLELVTFDVTENSDGTATIIIRSNQPATGTISYEHQGKTIELDVSLTDDNGLTQTFITPALNTGVVYNFKTEISNDSGSASANDSLVLTPTPSLKISDLRVKQIENDTITVVAKTNKASEGKICYTKNGNKYCEKVVFNNSNKDTQEIKFQGAKGDLETITLEVSDSKNTHQKSITVLIKDIEPKAVKMVAGTLVPLDYFNCKNMTSTTKISKINVGGDDQFTGSKNDKLAHQTDVQLVDSTIEYYKNTYGSQYNYQQTTFDSFTAEDDMITFAEIDLSQYKNISCVVAKIKGKQVNSWWTTDDITFLTAPSNVQNFTQSKMYPFLTMTTSQPKDFQWCVPTGDKGLNMFIKFISMQKPDFINSINTNKNLKFIYQDDAMLDYLEIYVVH